MLQTTMRLRPPQKRHTWMDEASAEQFTMDTFTTVYGRMPNKMSLMIGCAALQ